MADVETENFQDSDERDWLEVRLDVSSRRGVADAMEAQTPDGPQKTLLLRMLRASRDELLLDREQAQIVLDVLNVDRRLSALRARLEAFLGLR
jgi:hypothetical protein